MRVFAALALCAICLPAGAARPWTSAARERLTHSLIHRGDGKGRPDNTLEALLYTWTRGCTPESDIRLTKDGKVVAFHDRSLKGRPIGEWTWDELREEDVGSYRGKQYAYCRPPLWETIFTAMEENPSRRVHIDWKEIPPETVAAMVKAHGLEKQCWFIAASHNQIRRYKAALPTGQALQWMHLGNWNRIDFSNPEEMAYSEKFLLNQFERSAQEKFASIDIVQVHCQIRYDADGNATFCPRPDVLKSCIARLRAAGVEPSVFVCRGEANNPKSYKLLWEMGFDSFGTDYPEALYWAIADEMRLSDN